MTLSGRAIVIFAQRSARVRSAHALWLMTAILPTHKFVDAPEGCPTRLAATVAGTPSIASHFCLARHQSIAPLSFCRRSLLHIVCCSKKDIAQAAVRSTEFMCTCTKYLNTIHLQGKECTPEKPWQARAPNALITKRIGLVLRGANQSTADR